MCGSGKREYLTTGARAARPIRTPVLRRNRQQPDLAIAVQDEPMPLLIIVLLAILVAQVGFWKTFAAVLGAIGVVVLFIVLAVATVVLTVMYFLGRARGR
jgi:uncharacterized membrane protein